MKGITLIGMPASGKSTISQLLAEKLGWPVYDIDKIMEEKKSMPITQIISENGQEYIKKFEAQCVSELDLKNVILSPGGSIIYGKSCHGHMKKWTNIVWLDVPLADIEKRLASDPNNERGIVGLKNGLESLFIARRPAYEKLADLRIDAAGKTSEAVATEILSVAYPS